MREVIGSLVDFNDWANCRLLGAVEAPDGFYYRTGES